jgi:hypothetical protein
MPRTPRSGAAHDRRRCRSGRCRRRVTSPVDAIHALLDERLGAGQQAHDAEAADGADLGEQVVLDHAQVGADVAAGLGDEVHGAELERAEHVVALAVARDDDDRERALGSSAGGGTRSRPSPASRGRG